MNQRRLFGVLYSLSRATIQTWKHVSKLAHVRHRLNICISNVKCLYNYGLLNYQLKRLGLICCVANHSSVYKRLNTFFGALVRFLFNYLRPKYMFRPCCRILFAEYLHKFVRIGKVSWPNGFCQTLISIVETRTSLN